MPAVSEYQLVGDNATKVDIDSFKSTTSIPNNRNDVAVR